MKRSGRLPRISGAAARKKRLDALARQVVFARDGYQCVRCGKGDRLQWCHVRSRRYSTTRWHSSNALTLCAGDHLWWHHNPTEAVAWWNEKYPERANFLKLAQTWRKSDLTAVELGLQQELKGYTG